MEENRPVQARTSMAQQPAPISKKEKGLWARLRSSGEDTQSLELNGNPVDVNALISRNAFLDAKRAKLKGEKTKLVEDNERLRHENTNLWIQVSALEDLVTKLSNKLEESERIRDAQTEELKQLQSQEYEKTRSAARESHEAISSQFREIFRQCSDWAKDYFNIKIVDFDMSKFSEFRKELEEVSWENSDWGSKNFFKASHLVQAVLGNMICSRIFASPFSGTPLDHRQFQDLYRMKCNIDRAEAQRWRASSLQAFYSCPRWPLSSQESYLLESYKEQYATHIVCKIEEVLRPITTAHYPSLSPRELREQSKRLRAIVEYAKTLNEKMSRQSSELQMLSKSRLSNNNRLFIPNDPRVKSRIDDEDYDPQAHLRIDLILSPGFLKYGNDNAENLDDWSVWTPAIVEIHGPARPLPPPPSRPPTTPARTPPVFSSADSEELPREKQKKEAESLSATAEQHREDEGFEEVESFHQWY